MRSLASIAIAFVFASDGALAQATTEEPPPTATDTTPALKAPAITEGTDEKKWSFSASAYTYIVPDSQVYVQPTIMAERGWLHLEARYNYENLKTGSLWVGYNFSVGEKLALEFTPMVGGVMGDTDGIAPGYRLSLSYWKLELASEGEYVFDARDAAENFFYNWSELSISPVDWFRVGVVSQRTKLYQTEFDIQRGFLVGFSFWKMDLTAYVFNPDASQPTVVVGVGLSF